MYALRKKSRGAHFFVMRCVDAWRSEDRGEKQDWVKSKSRRKRNTARKQSGGKNRMGKSRNGGAGGIRTPDLLDAIEARSQLRHGPTVSNVEKL
jgi:hypothetical protein